jgi:serine/threonine-protein kinase
MDNAALRAISLKSGQVKTLHRGGYYGRYLLSGHLLYFHQGVLYGARFDPGRLEMQGPPVPVIEDVAANQSTGGGQFGVSAQGTFVYSAGRATQGWQVAWLDTSGKTQPLLSKPGDYTFPRLSPDGRKLAFTGEGAGADVYVYDLERDTTARLTFKGDSQAPEWAPDGKHLAFASASSIFWVRTDGAGGPHLMLEGRSIPRVWSFTRDGRHMAFHDRNSETGFDIWTLPLDLSDPDNPKPGKPELYLRTPADELVPRFSPDGRWIAYRSTESGNGEIYVRPFPAAGGSKWQISTGGGLYAFWSNNGRELFYETVDHRIMVLDYTVDGGSFLPGKQRFWSDKQLFYTGTSNLDLAPDGKRFVVFVLPEAAPGQKGNLHVTMLLNFFDELRRKLPQ